jgi:hypothetical protein
MLWPHVLPCDGLADPKHVAVTQYNKTSVVDDGKE